MIQYRSIRTNLFFLVSLIFIPLFAIVIHSAFIYKQSAKKFAEENSLMVARNLAEQQKLIENNTHQFLKVLSQLPEIKSGDSSKINSLLKSLLKENKSFASLILIRNTGEMIASGSTFYKMNVKDRKYFQEVMRTHSFAVGEYTRGRLSFKPVIHYAHPVMRNNHKAIDYVLAISFDLNYYNEIFTKSNLGKDALFKFMDRNGTVLYQSASVTDLGAEKNMMSFHKITSQKNESTFSIKGSDDIKRLFAIEYVSLGNEKPYMYIYVGVPEKIALSAFGGFFYLHVFIWLAGIFIVIISAYIFSRKFILMPIDNLVRTTRNIAEGNLEVRTGIRPSSEIGMLANAIDDMTEKLKQRDADQKKAQRELKRLKERFELATNAAHIGIWDWHIPNNIMIWDKNMFELYGILPGNFTFKYESWKDLVMPQDWVYLDAEFQNAIDYHRPIRSEFRIKHPVQGIKYIRIFANVIDDKNGSPVRLIGVNWDMTDRKILEQKLHKAKHKAETNDKLKSTFLANVSHEIRTPIHGIIGFAQILKDQNVSEPERLQYLDIIVSSGNKLMNVISNIIDISMLDSKQLRIQENCCNLQNLLMEIFENFEKIRTKDKKEFSFVLESEIDSSMALTIDEFRFKQIFSNLIENAFKYTDLGEVRFGCRIFNDELLCYVKDSGIGIRNEDMIKIFERFKQSDDSNRNQSGNGLGLAICKGLLDLMGGKIWAVAKDNGSDFYFSIPLVLTENTASEASESYFA